MQQACSGRFSRSGRAGERTMSTSVTPPASSMASGKDSIALLPIGSSALGVAGEFSGYSRLPVSLASSTAWNASGMAGGPSRQDRRAFSLVSRPPAAASRFLPARASRQGDASCRRTIRAQLFGVAARHHCPL